MEYNYTQLLAFDCCTSVSYTKSQGSRKLIAWKDRISATDKPQTLEVDFLDNTIPEIGTTTSIRTVTFQSITNNEALYTGTNLQVKIKVVNKTMSIIYTHPLGGVQYEVIDSAQIEGFYTLQDLGNGAGNGGSDPIRVNVVDPQVRNGDDIVRIRYEEIHRGAVTDELDHYLYSRLNTITNESIKGHELQGTWRLTDIIKQDSDDPDLIRLTLEYKRGYATTLDFSEAVLVNKEDYRTDTTKIIIQFNNIDPRYVETAKDVYRSQETLSNPVFGGVVYDGFWHNIRMITSETAMSDRGADMSSAVSVTWLLTQHNNTDVYFKFKQSPAITKGFFYKWDATETTLNSLIANTHFKANGDQDTDNPPAASSKTLQEDMPGRTVVMRRTSRDEEDRLYDLEIELTFFTGIAVTSNNFGTYSVENTVTVKENQSSLPSQNDLNFSFEADGTQSTSKTLAGPNGTGNPVINNNEQFDFSIVSEKIKVTETAGINNVTDGTDFHVVGMGKRATRNNIVKNTSFQQIRRRIGGELEFPRDPVTGELEGVDWDESWNSNSNANGGTYPNATAPDNWISAGYQERYGNWQPYWVEALVVGENSLVQPDNETAQFKGMYQSNGSTMVNRGDIFVAVTNPGTQNESSTFYKVNVLVSGATFSGNTPLFRSAGNRFYTRLALNVYVTENNSTQSCDLFGPAYTKYGPACWQDGVIMAFVELNSNNHQGHNNASKSDIRSKIGRAGTGLGAQFPTTHLFDIDYYIAIKEPLTRELDWDNTWEWNSTTTYANNHIIFYNQNEKLYKAKNSPSAGTLPTDASKWDEVTDSPTTWTNNYASVYGPWMTRWTKGFLTGEGSLIESFHGGVPRNRGIGHSVTDVYHFHDVILTQSTAANRRQDPEFKSFNGGVNLAGYNGNSNYALGDIVAYEGQIYTASSAIYQNATGAPVGFIDNGPKIPGTANGSQWSKGATSALNEFVAINTNNVRAKIALKGSGIAPFEVPEEVKVLSSSGTNAISKTAKMAFYTNPNENPRMSEIIECTKRDEMEITLRTYFALNPDYLLPANRRIPVDVNDLDALRDWVLGKLTFSSTNSATRLRVPQEFVINNEKSNYELSFVRGRDRDIFYIDAIIILRTEFVKDTSAMEAIKQRLTNTDNAKITDDKIVVQRDLTPNNKPWSGDFLDK